MNVEHLFHLNSKHYFHNNCYFSFNETFNICKLNILVKTIITENR